MKFVTKVTQSGIARAMASALVLAVIASSTGLIMAEFGPEKFTISVAVYQGDPLNNIKVSGASLKLVADDASNPDTNLQGTTDGAGNYIFTAYTGSYNLEVSHPNYYSRTYHINVYNEYEVDVSLIPLASQPAPTPTPTPTPEGVGCLPTPPRGQPLLNIWPISTSGADCTDYPLLMARNVTKDTGYTHGATVSASGNDIVRFHLYVHNGTVDYPENEAINAFVKATLPNTTGSATIAAEAWANNAARINSAQKGGNITVSMGTGESLELVSGSTKIYSRGPVLIGSGSDAVVGAGQSLGNMRGCYEFLRIVTFDAKVKAAATIGFEKLVRNVSDNQSTFSKSTNADTNEVVEYQIRLFTSGTVNNIVVSDTLPNRLDYIADTLTLDGTKIGNSLNSINVGSMTNQTKLIKYKAKIASISSFIQTSTTLVNNARLTSSAGSQVESANVVVQIVTTTEPTPTPSPSPTPTPTPTPVPPPIIAIDKLVRNVSDNQTIFTDSTNADPGEQVEFQLKVTTAGTANNVVISDVLPARLTFIAGSLTLDGAANSSWNSISLGTQTDSTRIVKFKATVADASQFTEGTTTTLTNTGSVASSAGNHSDTANVVVTRPIVEIPVGTIALDKLVRNVSDGQTSFTNSTSADPGEQVEFQIKVTVTNTVNNIKIVDTLPNRLSYITNSLRIEGEAAGNDLSNILVGTMTSTSKNVIIRATVAEASQFVVGSTNLTNSATVTSSAGSKTDTADVIVTRASNPGSASLAIEKTVRNITTNPNGSYTESVDARKDEIVEFRIIVRNNGSVTATTVRVQDILPSNPAFSYVAGSLTIDGASSGLDIFSAQATLGDLAPNASKTLIFRAKVPTITFNSTVTNTANAFASNTGSVTDTAQVVLVPVQGGNVSLLLSKKAYNFTQSKDAATVTAKPGDVIIYTLTVQNVGSLPAQNYTFEDNIADVLQLSDVTNFGGGTYTVSKIMVWPTLTIPANSTVEKTFSVMVKNPIPSGTDSCMINTFGNEVRVCVSKPFVAPTTGTASTMALILALLSVSGFSLYRKYRVGKLTLDFLR
jgi:uncharacterized repeat protein (TIGR01451 family)